MNDDKLYVVLPCYNEQDNIKSLTEKWIYEKTSLQNYRLGINIVIIDDGSTDHTLTIINGIHIKYDNVIVLEHEENKGLGEALNTGINYVLEQDDAKYMVIMDSDNTQSPSYIHSMLKKLKDDKLQCVIASRYQKGAKTLGVTTFRRMLSMSARLVYTFSVRIPNVKDYTCGYRLYDVSFLRYVKSRLSGNIIQEKGFTCMMELLYKIHRAGGRIGEVPFVLRYYLKSGESKINVMETIRRSFVTIKKINLKRRKSA